MGNGPLLQGIGYGDATVLNVNPAIQQLGGIIAQQKAEQKAKDDALIKQMASLKAEGIRAPDKDGYLKKYNDWKQTAIMANSLPKNSKERLEAIAAAQAQYNDLGDFIARSKEAKQHENTLANMRLQNPHMFSNDADERITQSLSSAIDSSTYLPYEQYNTLDRYVDPMKINDLLDKGKKKALDDTPFERYQLGAAKEGDKQGIYVQNKKNIPYEKVVENYLHLATINPEFRKFLHDQYKEIQGENDAETTALRIRKLTEDRNELNGWSDAGNKEFKANYAPDKYYEHRAYAASHPLNGGIDISQGAANDITIPYAGGKGVVDVKNYVGLSIPKKNFAGTPAYNLTTGKRLGGLESSGDYSIVGVGNFPFVTKGNFAGTIAQPKFAANNPGAIEYRPMVHIKLPAKGEYGEDEDFVIDYSRLPQNIKESKPIKTALSTFKASYPTSSKPSKKVNVTDVSSIFK